MDPTELRRKRNREHMRFVRSFPNHHEYERALVFKRLSLLVDSIDFYRTRIPEEDWVKSPKIDLMYRSADALIVRLRRLGAF